MNWLLRTYLVVVLAFIYTTLKAQNLHLTNVEGTILLKNAYQLKYSLPDSAIQIVDFIDAKKTIHDTIIHDAFEIGGDAYWHKGNFVKSIEYYNRAIILAKKINDLPRICKGYSNLGYLYMEIGEYERAIEEYKKSMELALNNNLSDHYLITSSYLAQAWGRLKHYDKAIALQKKVLKKIYELNDSVSLSTAVILNNIANSYSNGGKIDSAQVYYEKAVEIARKLSAEQEIANNLVNLSAIYYDKSMFDKAHKAVVEAIELYNKKNTISTLSLAYTILAKIYAQQNNFDQALIYMDYALNIAQKTGSKKKISSAYLECSKIYKKNR